VTLAKAIAWADLGQVLIQASIALAIVTVLAVALGWVVAGRILRPLSTITAAARQISASNLNERLSLHGPDDELKALGDTLDDLFTRLEASFQAQRHFVANASHELRTPLTRERTMLQVALDDPGTTAETWREVARDVLASNAEQEGLIEALLALAASEGGLDCREPVDLAAVTGEVLLARRHEAGRLGLHIEADTRPAVFGGDPLLAERLVANLIDNAVRHNVADGMVEVTTRSRNGCAVLSVASTGPLIPPDEVARLFEPFQRLHPRGTRTGTGNDARNGHGLGLSIGCRQSGSFARARPRWTARSGLSSLQRSTARERAVVHVRSWMLTSPATASRVLRATRTPSWSAASVPDSSPCRRRTRCWPISPLKPRAARTSAG
jgi:signal transduction histidine kinase